MPEIQLPRSDANRTGLLQRLVEILTPMAAADRPIPAETFAALTNAHTLWEPVARTYRTITSTQRRQVSELGAARTTAETFVSHYFQVFNLAIRRNVYAPSDRAFFGLPVASADLPALHSDSLLTTALTNIAAGDAALVQAGRSAMANPSAAEVAAKGSAFLTLLQQRGSSGQTTITAAGDLDALRPVVDAALADAYAELKHGHRKLAPARWRTLARTFGFRFINTHEEKPEGRYEGPVAAGQLLEVYEGTFGADLRVRLHNPGLTDWEIGLAPTDTAIPAPVLVRAGTTITLNAPDLGNIAHPNLLLRNRAADQLGAWEVEFDPAE